MVELIAIVVAGTVALLLEVVAGIPAEEILLFEVVLEEDTGVCC